MLWKPNTLAPITTTGAYLRKRHTGSSLAIAAATGAALSASALGTSGGVLAAQEVIELPAENRLLEAGFEELYRVGSLQGDDWDTFGRVAGVAFVESSELDVHTVVVKRLPLEVR